MSHAQPLASRTSDPTGPTPWYRQWELPVLAALVLAVYFTRLTAAPVCGEESRWASAAREMIATGDWIVPRQQGTIFPERPPLGSWAMALVGLARGQVDLVAIRLPSAMAMLLTTLGIYLYAQCWLSRLGAFGAAAMFATFGQVLALGRLGESEALFTLFVAGSLMAWHAAYLTRRSPQLAWCAGYGLAALGALVKGPQAPVYFTTVCGAFLLFERNWRWLFSWGHALGVACFAAVVGAWFVPFALTDWAAVDDIWAGLAQDRFTLTGLPKHLVNYPVETFGCLLPWSPLLLVLCKPSAFRAVLAERPQARFVLVALAVTYPSVWFAAGARGRYYMPLYPCLAVLMGLALEHCAARMAAQADRMFWRHFQRTTAIIVLVCGAIVVVASLVPIAKLAPAGQSVPFLLLAWIPGVVLAAAVLIWASQSEQLPRPQLAVLGLCGFLGLAHVGVMLNARLQAANDLHPPVAELKQKLVTGELVSLGRVYHRFAYTYESPIRQIPWPNDQTEVPSDVEYFCFDRRPGDTDEARSTSDGRLSTTTSGRLPFEWEEVARIPCDPVHRDVHDRTVIIGRVRRGELVADRLANQPARR